MSREQVYSYLERLANLLRAEARQSSRLQPVQLEVLHYLSICNRHSNISTAVAEYLGLTKGTVSQTLSVLERKGYLKKLPDAQDKRIVHLHLTAKGKAALAASLPPKALRLALEQMTKERQQQLVANLDNLLKAMQSARSRKAFGVCKTCGYLQATESGYRCGLTELPLSFEELELICREHSPLPDSS
ncbi:MarR family transcriptional regulator [Methylothermus subterraneus]